MFIDRGPNHIDMRIQKTQCPLMIYYGEKEDEENNDYKLQVFNSSTQKYPFDVIKSQDIENDMMCSGDEFEVASPEDEQKYAILSNWKDVPGKIFTGHF